MAVLATSEAQSLLAELVAPERLRSAFARVAQAEGAPGVDGIGVAAFGERLDDRLTELAAEVIGGAYRPGALLAVRTPRDRDPRGRELLIPTVRDRLLQRAAHDLLAPSLEGRLLPCVFGFRPKRSVRNAVDACRQAIRRRPWVVDADIKDFFPSASHRRVVDQLSEWIDDPGLLALVESWLEAPAVRGGATVAREAGLALGSPLSPLLANALLEPLDRALWDAETSYIRFADDFVVCCTNEEAARDRLDRSAGALAGLGLQLHEGKSRVVDARRESLVFLGHLLRSEPESTEPQYERPQRKTLHITEPGSRLSASRGRLVVRRDGTDLLSVPARRVRDVVVLAPMDVTSGAMTLCLEHGIDVAWLSHHERCWAAMRTWRSAAPETRRLQAALALDAAACLSLGRGFIDAKIHNQKRLLQRQRARGVGAVLDPALAELGRMHARVGGAPDVASLMGVEGAASRAFFGGFGRCVDPGLGFAGRVRRPPTDPVNALLSFGYTLATNEVASALWRSGLDADLGVMHQPKAGRPSLALDLVEELRSPVVDSLVLSVLHRRILRAEHFCRDPNTGGTRLTDPGRRAFLREYELRMLTLFTHEATGDRVSYRRATVLQAEQLSRTLRHPGTPYLTIRMS